MRRISANNLLRKHGGKNYKNFLFTNEKRQKKNSVHAHSTREADVIAKMQESQILLWFEDVTQVHLCEQGAKTSAKTYEKDVVEYVVRSLMNILFKKTMDLLERFGTRS